MAMGKISIVKAPSTKKVTKSVKNYVDKKIDSMQKASSKKIEITRKKFEDSLLLLRDKQIEPTQYNLRK